MLNFSLSAQLRQNFAPATKSGILAEARAITSVLNQYGTQSTTAFNQLKAASSTVRRLVGNPNVELALLFIDITSFATKTANKPAYEIAAILDAYYAELLPIIYEFEGEKIMGDGIVAVFGTPFTPGLYRHQWLQAAERCADKIGQARYNHPFSVKIAIHYGKLLYYHNDKTTIDEFYAIGQPMTELFRLEGEGIDKKITYYVNSEYDSHRKLNQSVLPSWWSQGSPRAVSLKGVMFNQVIDLT